MKAARSAAIGRAWCKQLGCDFDSIITEDGCDSVLYELSGYYGARPIEYIVDDIIDKYIEDARIGAE